MTSMRVTMPKPEVGILHDLTPEEEQELQAKIIEFKTQHGYPPGASDRKGFFKEIANDRQSRECEEGAAKRLADARKLHEKYRMDHEAVKARLVKIKAQKEGKDVSDPVEAKLVEDDWVVETEGMEVPETKVVYGGLE